MNPDACLEMNVSCSEVIEPAREPVSVDHAFERWVQLVTTEPRSQRSRVAGECLRIRLEDELAFDCAMRKFLRNGTGRLAAQSRAVTAQIDMDR